MAERAERRHNWDGPTRLDMGFFWRFGKRWAVDWTPWEVCVASVSRAGGIDGFTILETEGVTYTQAFMGGERMASKWIAKAVTKRTKRTTVSDRPHEELFGKRPALRDFMVELEAGEGDSREPSVLMVVITEDGVRVGLKDDGAGGWLWRVADSFAEGLDAIEKALQSGTAKWSNSQARRGRK